MKKWIISFAVTAALALTFSGCGGSDGSAGVGSSTPVTGDSTNNEASVNNSHTPNQFNNLPDVPFPDEMEQ